MKKVVLALIAIPIVVFIALSLMTSNKEYAAEKLFFRAGEMHNKIKSNPDVAPPALLKSLENNLLTIVKKYPKTESAKRAYLALAEVYMANERYGDCISIMDKFIASGEKEISPLSKAYFLKGLAYERQGDWNKALLEFTLLKEQYSNTPLGLQAPLYIANYYVKNNMHPQAENAFGDAAQFYKGLVDENSGNMLGYSSATMLMQAYMGLGKIEEAGAILQDNLNNYPVAALLVQQLPYVEVIYASTLKNPDKAIEIYTQIKEKINDDRIKQHLDRRIDQLKKSKSDMAE